MYSSGMIDCRVRRDNLQQGLQNTKFQVTALRVLSHSFLGAKILQILLWHRKRFPDSELTPAQVDKESIISFDLVNGIHSFSGIKGESCKQLRKTYRSDVLPTPVRLRDPIGAGQLLRQGMLK